MDEVMGEAAWPSCLGILHTPLPLHLEPKPVSPRTPTPFLPQILWSLDCLFPGSLPVALVNKGVRTEKLSSLLSALDSHTVGACVPPNPTVVIV